MLKKTLESPLKSKDIQPVHPKGNQSWVFTGRTDVEAETPILWPPGLTHLKRPWCWERLKVGGEGDDRGWDGWMASLTQWTWVWVSSRSWWWIGRPGVLQSMGLQKVGHDWVTELNWTESIFIGEWLLFYILVHKIIVIDGAFKLMKYTTSFTERKKKPYKSKQITRWIHISKMLKKI